MVAHRGEINGDIFLSTTGPRAPRFADKISFMNGGMKYVSALDSFISVTGLGSI